MSGLLALGAEAATTLSDFRAGLAFPIARLLQSPAFLFRHEIGANGPLGGGLSVDDLADAVRNADVPRNLVDFVRQTLQSRAELDHDEEEGRCLGLSTGLIFTAVPAWVAPW